MFVLWLLIAVFLFKFVGTSWGLYWLFFGLPVLRLAVPFLFELLAAWRGEIDLRRQFPNRPPAPGFGERVLALLQGIDAARFTPPKEIVGGGQDCSAAPSRPTSHS